MNLLEGMLTAAFEFNNIAGEPALGVVVATGLILVFLVLVLLWLLISLEGKIFVSIEKGKKAKPAAKENAQPTAKPAAVAGAQNSSMKIENGISQEIVAVIAAAIAAMEDGGSHFVLRAVQRAPQARNAWSRAGIAAQTEPF